MSTSTTLLLSETIWLCPRPLARIPGRFPLIPLLPEKPAPKSLPADIWNRVLEHVFALYNAPAVKSDEALKLKLDLLRISRAVNVSTPSTTVGIMDSSQSVGRRAPVILRVHSRIFAMRAREARCAPPSR